MQIIFLVYSYLFANAMRSRPFLTCGILSTMNLTYKRLLVKLSGEQLAGEDNSGFDPEVIASMASELRAAAEAGTQIVVMIGGGNFARGAQLAGHGVTRVTADYVGMLATMMNGLVLADMFNSANLPSRVLTNIKADQAADQFTARRALNHLQKGRVVIVAGGIGRPYLTTDTAAVNLALELDCDAVCKVTKVNGVYSANPVNNPDARRFEAISFQEALENPDILVMDKAALGLAMEQHKPIVVCDLATSGNLRRLVLGERIGTIIS